MNRLIIFAAVGIVSASAFAGPNTTRILSYEFAKYEGPASKPAPNIPRGKLLGVVELNNGTILSAPLVQGRIKGTARTASAVFPTFELDQVRIVGVKEAESSSYPAINDFNGVKVTAFPESGAKLIVRRLGQIHPANPIARNGYRAFPQVGTKDALPPVSLMRVAITLEDGVHTESTMSAEFESTDGLLAATHIKGLRDNAQSTFDGYIPIEIRPGTLHRVFLKFQRGFAPYVFDECRVKKVVVYGGDPDLPLTELMNSGDIDVKFGEVEYWMSPMLAKRRVSSVFGVNKVFYDLVTGGDDLRADTGEIRTSSRLVVTLNGTQNSGTALNMNVTIPSEMDIRRRAFNRWSTFSSSFDLSNQVSLSRLTNISVESVMGGGVTFGLSGDDWSFDGIRVYYEDAGGVRRILFSDFTRRKKVGISTDVFEFASQNNYVTDSIAPGAARRLGIPLPGVRPPNP